MFITLYVFVEFLRVLYFMPNTVIWAQLPGINSVMMMQRKAEAETDMTTGLYS